MGESVNRQIAFYGNVAKIYAVLSTHILERGEIQCKLKNLPIGNRILAGC